MLQLLFRKVAFFSKITPQIASNLKMQFQKQPSLKALGSYYTSTNVPQLFNLIITSRITPIQSNGALDSLLELCRTESDEQLNLMVNVMKQKAINYARLHSIPESIDAFQQAVSTILLMKHPNQMALTQLYKFIGDMYVQTGQLKKAEKSLKQAENLLKQLAVKDPDAEDYIHSGLASIYTQLSMVHYREKKPIQAFQELKNSLSHWQKAPQKAMQEYELTCRMKCMLHVLRQQMSEAVQTARYFLDFLEKSPQFQQNPSSKSMVFTKLYYLNVICSYQPESKQEEIEVKSILEVLGKQVGEQRLKELMNIVGILPQRYHMAQ